MQSGGRSQLAGSSIWFISTRRIRSTSSSGKTRNTAGSSSSESEGSSLGGVDVWLTAPEDLLLSKLVWARESGSELQLRDAANLIASVPDLDWPYIARWAPALGVARELEALKA